MQTHTFMFYGIVGSGKGTQIKLLMDFLKQKSGLESVYAGTGDGFRKLLETDNYTASLVKDSMLRGELQPDFLTTSLFTSILISSLNKDKYLFADGYPRTIVQSENFEEMMKYFKRENIKIIYIELSKEEATKRMKLRARPDDTDEGIAKRLNEYINNVVPSMNYFKEKEGYEIFTINGEQSIEDVHSEIINKLGFSF